MPVKRIQLRGISRNPSDRMTADGGCAESMNVHLDTQELAPSIVPVPLDLPTGYEYIYIHKTTAYTNYIALQNGVLMYIDEEGTIGENIVSLQQGESINAITSIGNTIVVATNQRTLYYIFKSDEGYVETLGQMYNGPDILFYPGNISVSEISLGTSDSQVDLRYYDNARTTSKLLKKFFNPVFMIAAYKMFNGDYVQALPQLVGYNSFLPFNMRRVQETGEESAVNLHAFMNYIPWLRLMDTSMLELLKSTVQSIDVFMSDDIDPFIGQILGDFDATVIGDAVVLNSIDGEAELLKHSQFFKVASYSLSDDALIEELSQGKAIDISEVYLNEDRLVKEQLPTDIITHDALIFDNMMVLNNRLAASVLKKLSSRGLPFAVSQFRSGTQDVNPAVVSDLYYQIAYYIRTESGNEVIVYGHSVDGYGRDKSIFYPFVPEKPVYQYNETRWIDEFRPAGFLMHPDPNCYKAVIFRLRIAAHTQLIGSTTIDMKTHPNLNCSYGIVPPQYRPFPMPLDMDDITKSQPTEQRESTPTNKMYLTEIDNPFYFSAKGEHIFSSDIIGFATTTKALSTGQIGQFPIYVFTAEGIWSMQLNSLGEISNTFALTRDVAIPGTISPIDNAIVFVSEKGVMLLSGSEVSNLSPNMIGEHYVVTDDVTAPFASGTLWHDLLGAIDSYDFMLFMKSAKIAFDYANSRLICFNASKTYQYVYMLKTQSWHKIATIPQLQALHVLNSYPATYIAVSQNNVKKIMDFSPFMDVQSTVAVPGVIATRPFDLDEPDVRKQIKDIRVRGHFNRADVKYVLLGSMDGLTFGVVNSLRAFSYKTYRLVLLTNLTPTERISWVDVEYEARYTNKLR